MDTLFDMPEPCRTHPAKYTDALLTFMATMLEGCHSILDPFAGTGKVFTLCHWLPEASIQAIELEPEWAELHPDTQVGNALHLPFGDATFDGICTSPTYGNRMADHHEASDHSKRNTYRHSMGRILHQDNSGLLQWGREYRLFHRLAWTEATRVLKLGGKFVLNIKDHIRAGSRQFVTEWHIDTLESMGYTAVRHEQITTPSLRYGQNAHLRVEYESVIQFRKGA